MTYRAPQTVPEQIADIYEQLRRLKSSLSGDASTGSGDSGSSSGSGGGVTDHGALTGLGDDDHSLYQLDANKSAANGYASLDSGTKVPTVELGGAGATSSKFLRGDQSWALPPGSSGAPLLPFDIAPGTPHAKDDEFDGSSLDGKWTNPTTSAAGQTNTIVVANNWMTLEPATTGEA